MSLRLPFLFHNPSLTSAGYTVSRESGYWSSTGVGQATRIMAWFVFFADGDVDNGGKTISTFIHVRAVRGGL